LGRRIFDNLRKAMAYILAIHVPIAGLSLIPVILGWPLLLFPAHVVFLELIIDPTCSIVFEAERAEANVMKRPPRSQTEPLFSRNVIITSLLQGLLILVMVAAIYGFNLQQGRNEMESRTITFICLVFANLGLIMANRFRSMNVISSFRVKNKSLWWVLGIALVLLTMVIYIPVLRDIFQFKAITIYDLGFCLLVGLISIAGCDLIKYFSVKFEAKK
jgi:Ca2+-transporting ATPase